MDQDTLAAQARDTWHYIQDGDSCRVLPIEDATLLELKLKILHMRTLHEVFYNMKYNTYWNHTVIITIAVVASMDGGLWPLSSCRGIDGLGIPYYFVALVDAGMWPPIVCGGTVLTLAPVIIRSINVVNEKLLNKGRFTKCPQKHIWRPAIPK